jgi:murein DD-endopeptidase MepM/ murein hydrolase activator NlpD
MKDDFDLFRFSGLHLAMLVVLMQGCGGNGGKNNAADASCMQAAAGTYPQQSTSLYSLPYSIGETYVVVQGNCTAGSHNESVGQQFAYDFEMPIGTALVASRGGVVVGIEESFSDGTRTPGEENFVAILHDDGTTGRYIHVTTQGALVELKDIVSQGDAIAMSGNSGNSTGPHLHFDVVRDPDDMLCLPQQRSCLSVPVNFRNTSAHVNGLIEGRSYTAEQP